MFLSKRIRTLFAMATLTYNMGKVEIDNVSISLNKNVYLAVPYVPFEFCPIAEFDWLPGRKKSSQKQ